MKPDDLAKRIVNRATAGAGGNLPLSWEEFFTNSRNWDTLTDAQRIATNQTWQQIITQNEALGIDPDEPTDYPPTALEFQ